MKTLIGKLFMDLDKIATPTARSVFLSDDPSIKEKEFAFFCSLKLKSGVTKTTDRNRMRDVDAWLAASLPKDKKQNVFDVAISSGITTVELCETFDEKNISYQITAMDSDITAFLIIFNDEESILVDKTGFPIHFEINGKGFGYVKGTNPRHFVERALLKFKSKPYVDVQLIESLGNSEEVIKKNGAEIHRIEMVCREVKKHPFIKLAEDSIFAENSETKYSLIRAANILNKAYFDDEKLTDAIQKLGNRLEIGGHFLICRTNFEGQNNASLFKLIEPNKFELVGRFGDGSEVENLVLNLKSS